MLETRITNVQLQQQVLHFNICRAIKRGTVLRRRRCPVQQAGPRVFPMLEEEVWSGSCQHLEEVTATSSVAVDSTGCRRAGISP
jgi:hypothetical protein